MPGDTKANEVVQIARREAAAEGGAQADRRIVPTTAAKCKLFTRRFRQFLAPILRIVGIGPKIRVDMQM